MAMRIQDRSMETSQRSFSCNLLLQETSFSSLYEARDMVQASNMSTRTSSTPPAFHHGMLVRPKGIVDRERVKREHTGIIDQLCS